MRGVLAQYDETPWAQLDALAGMRVCGRQARADSVTAEVLVNTIRGVWWDDPTIEVWGESVLIPMCTALLAYYGEDEGGPAAPADLGARVPE